MQTTTNLTCWNCFVLNKNKGSTKTLLCHDHKHSVLQSDPLIVIIYKETKVRGNFSKTVLVGANSRRDAQ
jgi:hypothetical protein